MQFSDALEFTRYNSGAHFLDSGDAYGRHWQRPAPDSGDVIRITEDGGIIETTQWLADWFDFHDLATDFEESDFYTSDDSWFESADGFMTELGYRQLTRDNTYNNENNFSQDFVWEVWAPEDSDVSDWVWADADRDRVVVVIYVHTGCDIRGGYSPPMFLVCDDGNCEYVFPLTWVCSYGISDTRDARLLRRGRRDGGDSRSHEVAEDNGLNPDEWCAGYSSEPWYHMTEQLTSAGFTKMRTLKTGWAFMNPETRETIHVGASYWP